MSSELITELCDTADEQLFDKIQHNMHYLLHYLLPAPSAASQCYNHHLLHYFLPAPSAAPQCYNHHLLHYVLPTPSAASQCYKHHLLHYLLPPPSAASQCYNLRRRPHTSCFRNTVDILWTLTSSLEYYTKTFIDAIMKLSTHTLNHGLTVIIPLLLLLLTILRSAKHGQ